MYNINNNTPLTEILVTPLFTTDELHSFICITYCRNQMCNLAVVTVNLQPVCPDQQSRFIIDLHINIRSFLLIFD